MAVKRSRATQRKEQGRSARYRRSNLSHPKRSDGQIPLTQPSPKGRGNAAQVRSDRLAPSRRVKLANLQFEWAEGIAEHQWQTYRDAIEAVRDAGIRFMLGGGFALAAFIGRWRDTKDIDFYIHPRDRDAAVAALSRAGFEDYHSRLAYDRNWIYRSFRSDTIVDIIWSMANQRAQVDEAWFERAGSLSIRSQRLMVVPREEFMWCKLYILQRDHCDWTDVMNLLHASGREIDWDHLLERLEDDTPLLKGLFHVYGWMCPEDLRQLPRRLWRQLKMAPPLPPENRAGRNRVRLLDSRAWFSSSIPSRGQKLDV